MKIVQVCSGGVELGTDVWDAGITAGKRPNSSGFCKRSAQPAPLAAAAARRPPLVCIHSHSIDEEFAFFIDVSFYFRRASRSLARHRRHVVRDCPFARSHFVVVTLFLPAVCEFAANATFLCAEFSLFWSIYSIYRGSSFFYEGAAMECCWVQCARYECNSGSGNGAEQVVGRIPQREVIEIRQGPVRAV